MKIACVFLVLAVSSALAMQIRHKRQSNQPDDTNDLEDRYGPWQGRPNGNRFPGQGQINRFPGLNSGRFPGQNQEGFPGQNPGGFPGQNPGGFPGQNPGQGQLPGGGVNNQQQVLPPTTANPNDTTMRDCMRNCPVTSEYNPVCGTDGTTYTNPGRLACAQACGVNVALMRSAPCPATTTTAAPRT